MCSSVICTVVFRNVSEYDKYLPIYTLAANQKVCRHLGKLPVILSILNRTLNVPTDIIKVSTIKFHKNNFIRRYIFCLNAISI
jgi:hypothetical protein